LSLTITGKRITSDRSFATAERQGDAGARAVSWLPRRPLNRSQALTAMTLADRIGPARGDWAVLSGEAAAPGMSDLEAMARIHAWQEVPG
jgi:hypothetical protein